MKITDKTAINENAGHEKCATDHTSRK